jgi:FMN reductase
VVNVVSLTGNPRPRSRSHELCRTLAAEIARALGTSSLADVDLAPLSSRVLDPDDPDARTAVSTVLAADVLVVASPTYKATFSGLLKAFLDRFGTGALKGIRAVPVLLGGAPDHRLAVDVHFTPLLLELGATVPVRGLFVLEAELAMFPERAAAWAQEHSADLQPPGVDLQKNQLPGSGAPLMK